MKETELRIGNLVLINGIVTIVTGIAMGLINPTYSGGELFDDGNIDEAKPIPLTEEWLLKFGFINEDGTNERKWAIDYRIEMRDKVFFSISKYNFNCGFFDFKEKDCNFVNLHVYINHVHQLQNLYFALTGEELEIK